MKIVIAGATGFIGTPLSNRLLAAGHAVATLSRDPARARSELPGAGCLGWDGRSLDDAARAAIAEADGVVNLAGASIAGRRWSAKYQEEIRQSRVESTRALVEAMLVARRPGAVLVGGSGTGYYGDRGDAEVGEETPAGDDFLAQVCREWEAEARRATEAGARVVLLRTGIVLGKGGGALDKMVGPFRLGIGGPLGNGRQWFPWIHLDDEVGLIEFVLSTPHASGPMNATAPNPVTMKEFARALGRALHRPAFLPVPRFALRLAVGKVAGALLSGQRALPQAALRWGYHFQHPLLAGALANIFA